MAAYISVPRDLTKVKSKVAFNLTKRQLLCFGMEKLLSYYVQSRFLRPKIRPYKTNNYYALLMKGGVTHDPVLEKDR